MQLDFPSKQIRIIEYTLLIIKRLMDIEIINSIVILVRLLLPYPNVLA
jgi:hypothetical protein